MVPGEASRSRSGPSNDAATHASSAGLHSFGHQVARFLGFRKRGPTTPAGEQVNRPQARERQEAELVSTAAGGNCEHRGQNCGCLRQQRRAASLVEETMDAAAAQAVPEGQVVVPVTVKYGETIAGLSMRFKMSETRFRKLNKLYGSDLYIGQLVYVTVPKEVAEKTCQEVSDPTPQVANSDSWGDDTQRRRRKSQLDGDLFESIVLIDRKIQVRGSVEVNQMYVSFQPQSFIKAAIPLDSATDLRKAQSLLRSYSLRLDWRDIDGCNGGERRRASSAAVPDQKSPPTPPPPLTQLEQSHEHFSEEASRQQHPTLERMSSTEIAAEEVEKGTRDHAYIIQVFWSNTPFGFASPRPITLCCDDVETCTSLVNLIQEKIIAQREKSKRLAMLKRQETESVTYGAVVSGLLFKPDRFAPLSGAEPLSPSSPTTQAKPRASSTFGADLVQQAFMNGEITEEEAMALQKKNEEVLEKMEMLEQAHAEMKKHQQQVEGAWRIPFRGANSQQHGSDILRELSSSDHFAIVNPYRHSVPRVPPKFSGRESRIVEDESELTDIHMELPETCQARSWVILYDFMQHGASLRTLYQNLEGHEETLILIKTRSGERFGAFATEQWTPTRPREYYGTGESFVFTFKPDLHVFKWAGANDCFLSSSSTHLGMGAGAGGFAFCVDADLDHGSSNSCKTFGLKEPLTQEEDFRISEMEVIGFETPLRIGARPAEQTTPSNQPSLFTRT